MEYVAPSEYMVRETDNLNNGHCSSRFVHLSPVCSFLSSTSRILQCNPVSKPHLSSSFFSLRLPLQVLFSLPPLSLPSPLSFLLSPSFPPFLPPSLSLSPSLPLSFLCPSFSLPLSCTSYPVMALVPDC